MLRDDVRHHEESRNHSQGVSLRGGYSDEDFQQYDFPDTTAKTYDELFLRLPTTTLKMALSTIITRR